MVRGLAPLGHMVAAALLALFLLAGQAGAARMFDHKQPLKRTVGRARRSSDGKLSRKVVDSDRVGRAQFDPSFAHEDYLEADDLGLNAKDMHAATTGVVEERLKELFPKIDANHDGVISLEELHRHLYANGISISRRRSAAEFAETDTNRDGRVSALEYLASMLDEEEEGGAAKRKQVEEGGYPEPLDYGSYIDATRAAMVYADGDHDGSLNQEEFFDFLNPEEGSNFLLKLHRLRQDIYEYLADEQHARRMMHTGDGLQLTFDQFYQHLWSQFTVWESHSEEAEWTDEKEKQNARRKFLLLDTNSDGTLSAEELVPAYSELHPTESRYARMQAEHMMDMAECKDDRLTLDKMLAMPHAFYGVVSEDSDHTEL